MCLDVEIVLALSWLMRYNDRRGDRSEPNHRMLELSPSGVEEAVLPKHRQMTLALQLRIYCFQSVSNDQDLFIIHSNMKDVLHARSERIQVSCSSASRSKSLTSSGLVSSSKSG